MTEGAGQSNADHVLDYSVLTVTSVPPDGAHVWSHEEIDKVQDWIDAFVADSSRMLVLDSGYAMWSVYQALVPEASMRVLVEKIDRMSSRTVTVAQSVGGAPMVADQWEHIDEDRRWILGVALGDPTGTSIANATHEEWHASRIPADRGGVNFEHILDGWLDEQIAALQRAQNIVRQQTYYHPPERLRGALANAEPVGKGHNRRNAWEDGRRRYEFDSRHNTVEVFALGAGEWACEMTLEGGVLKDTGGEGRKWGKS